jgi:hypothetical protein
MTNTELMLELNALVSRFLNDGGDPSFLTESLREIADEVFEEDEEDDNFDPDRRGGPSWISG